MRIGKGLLLTAMAALAIGYWIDGGNIPNGFTIDAALNRIGLENPFSDTLKNTNLDEKIEILTSKDGKAVLMAPFTSPETIDYVRVENEIMRLLNELRAEKGLNTLTKNEMLKQAADYRAVETGTSFSHTRPDGSEFYTVFQNEAFWYEYQTVGENLAMATYFKDEEGMAAYLFNGWMESEGHYANMVRPEYKEVGIGVHYDGEFLYAVQLFGTQRS